MTRYLFATHDFYSALDKRSVTIRAITDTAPESGEIAETWFVAKDVCIALRLKLNNGSAHQQLRHLNDYEIKSMADFGAMGNAKLISTSGLFKLIKRAVGSFSTIEHDHACQFGEWAEMNFFPY